MPPRLITELYARQAARWPAAGRHILAQFDDDSVVVYQAYRPAIGRYAATHGRFGGDFSFERMKQTVTLVNSNWTGCRVREIYGMPARTVYPPVPGTFPDIPWERREDGFVCIGRFDPGKRLEFVADVLGRSVAVTGFYSYGEISPVAGSGECKLHNQTMTVTVFSEA